MQEQGKETTPRNTAQLHRSTWNKWVKLSHFHRTTMIDCDQHKARYQIFGCKLTELVQIVIFLSFCSPSVTDQLAVIYLTGYFYSGL